ncbi:hypothetical protein ACWGDE_31575 [Streptomyces sp. NPDC054956]
MGIELELHSERPRRHNRKKSETTLLRSSYEHGDALAQVLATLKANGPGKLWWVDPYGDTMFNEQEAEAALQEIAGLLEKCTYETQTDAVRDLDAMLKACAATQGSYLWFIGD